MKKLLSLTILFLAFLHSYSQEKSKWNMGFFAYPNLSYFEFEENASNTTLDFKNESLVSFGFGNMFLYDLSEKIKLSSNVGLEFYDNKISYIEANTRKSEKLELGLFSLSAQVDYYPLSNNFNLLIAYLPKIIVQDEESILKDNIQFLDHSADVGLGYNIKIRSMFSLHPTMDFLQKVGHIF